MRDALIEQIRLVLAAHGIGLDEDPSSVQRTDALLTDLADVHPALTAAAERTAAISNAIGILMLMERGRASDGAVVNYTRADTLEINDTIRRLRRVLEEG